MNLKAVPRGKTLAALFPHLVGEWDFDKNMSLSPKGVSAFSGKKVFWLCKRGHSWGAAIYNRTNGTGCPYCLNRKICSDNSLAAVNPRLSAEWHPTKNGTLTPNDVFPSGAKNVWWVCSKDHEWEAKVNNRAVGGGCPFCAGKRVSIENSFATKNPSLVSEWHLTKNGKLKPTAVTSRSGEIAWWKCRKGHEYPARIADRSAGRGCPVCRNQTSILELRVLSELEKISRSVKHRAIVGGVECDILLPQSALAIEIDGNYWHAGRGSQDKRKNAVLRQHKIECLRVRGHGLRKIAKHDIQISKTGETKPTIEVIRKVFEAIVKTTSDQKLISRIRGYLRGAEQFQNGKRFQELQAEMSSPKTGRSLAAVAPKLLSEWNVEKNKGLTPEDVSGGSHRKIWWICTKSHEWEAIIYNRVLGGGCPYCSGRNADSKNNLAVQAPELAKQWHTSKNGSISPKQVSPKSNKSFWWRCKKDHEWQASPNSRRNAKCPFCSKSRLTKEYSLGAIKPNLVKEWHPTRNGKLTPYDVFPGSGKKVWWKCRKGHEWKNSPNGRKKRGCPFCKGIFLAPERSLARLRPDLAKQWHPTKNRKLKPEDVFPSSAKKYWWLCEEGHSFFASPNCRKKAHCPECRNRRRV